MFSRTKMLFGTDAIEKLKNSRVAVFGCGGVGGYVIEALARGGIGTIDLVDNDKVSLSNINRQILATTLTVGKDKTSVAAERIKQINPDITVFEHNIFFMPDTSHIFNFSNYDYVVDAIDTVTGKIELIIQANKASVPIISSMGTGNKTDPTLFEIADIYKTSVCPLAKIMRYELKKRNIKSLKVVYSKEIPQKPLFQNETAPSGRNTPASCSFVPPVAGLIIAGEVIKDLLK